MTTINENGYSNYKRRVLNSDTSENSATDSEDVHQFPIECVTVL